MCRAVNDCISPTLTRISSMASLARRRCDEVLGKGEVSGGSRSSAGRSIRVSAVPSWSGPRSVVLEDLARPGCLSLICGPRVSSVALMETLGEAMSVEPISLTEVALSDVVVPSEQELLDRLAGRCLIFDLEVICWSPWLQLDPLRLLRRLARRQGVVAVWPGEMSGRLASFSAPDRRDYVSADARGVSVLRPVLTRFPDEVPFVIERISA